MEHDCIIGLLHHSEYSELVTLEELQQHIEKQAEAKAYWGNVLPGWGERKVFYLRDYADKRKNTDLTPFEYCPNCGKPIDWKQIRRVNDD